MSEIWAGVVSIATALVGLAIIATLVSRNAQTGSVIQAASGGFAQDIAAATGPVTGANSGAFGGGFNSLSNSGFGGFGGF